MSDASNPQIACCPDSLTSDERARSRALRAELAAATRETLAVQDGYTFQFAPDASLLQKTAEWISLERRCCPFLAFQLVWPTGEETGLCLTVTGPEGTRAFIAEEIPQLPHSR